MIHYTCDRCHVEITTSSSVRYVVQLDVQCVCETDLPDDESIDHLAIINEVLEAELNDPSAESGRVDGSLIHLLSPADGGESLTQPAELDKTRQKFDLCPECYRKYRRNPLARERGVSLQFSNN